VKAGLDRARSDGKVLGQPGVIVNRDRIVELKKEGLPLWQIGERLGISKSTAGRILDRIFIDAGESADAGR